MPIWKPTLEPSGSPVYSALADAISAAIDNRELHPGDQLPTHRDLARELGMARGTVARAYSLAETRGLVLGRTGSGTIVAWRKHASSVKDLYGDRRSDLIDLSTNYPLEHIAPELASELAAMAAGPQVQHLLNYSDPPGLSAHRIAGTRWLEAFGFRAHPDQVLVTSGTQQALDLVTSTVAEPGDTILVEELTYPGISAIGRHRRLRLEPVSMDDKGLLPEALDRACGAARVRALYSMPTFHNPTTATMPQARREEIAEILHKHRVPLIEDDIHRFQVPDAPPPISTLIPDLGYFVASMTKSVSPGLRVAFLAAPSQAIEKLAWAMLATSCMTAPLPVELACRWIDNGKAAAIAAAKNAEALKRTTLVRDLLSACEFRSEPFGFFVWLRLPRGLCSADLVADLQRRGVSITPGSVFASPRASAPDHVRICLGGPAERSELIKGLEIVVQALRSSLGVARPVL